MCEKLKVSSSGFYAWRHRSPSERQRRDAELVSHIRATRALSRDTYGSPRVYQDMKRNGVRAGRNRIARIMRENGLCCPKKRSFVKTTRSEHGLPIAPNLLERNFTADAINQKWVTDLTYISTAEGWVYLASIVDLFSRRVVGWAIADNMEVGLTLTALQRAIDSRRPPAGLIHHSDRGSQYASRAYQAALKNNAIICSMSAKGECWDNAVAESFFGRIKEELVHGTKWETKAQVIGEVGAYIEGFYNPVRRHSTIDFLSPIDYELAAARREQVA